MRHKNRKPYLRERLILLVILASIILISITTTYVKESKEEAPHCEDCNIILIVIDALRQDHVGTYGYYRNTTPNIDKLAEKSIVFQNAISQATWTKPSIASLFTSTYPSKHLTYYENLFEGHIGTNMLSDSFTTIAEKMMENGYKTYGWVNNGNIGPEFNFNQGFNEYKHIKSDNIMTAQLMDIIENHDKDDKFFMYLHYLGAHSPYTPAGRYKDLFMEDDHEYVNTTGKNKDDYRKLKVSKGQLEYIISQYDGEIRQSDARVGEILSILEKNGLTEKTIVIITSDHGESFKDNPKRFGHGHHPYETQIKVPLIIHIPGNDYHPMKIGSQVGLIDIAPTILNMTGIEIPNEMDGINMIPLIKGFNTNRSVYSERIRVDSTFVALKNGEWKYIIDIKTKKGKLFNLKEDPYEFQELKGYNKMKEKFKKEIQQHYNENRRQSKKNRQIKPIRISNETRKELENLGYL